MIGIGVGIIPFIAKIARAVSDYVIRVTSGGGVVEASDCANTQLTSLDSRNLYNNASFIIFPSGYKADVAYAELPANGNGDLTWSRASSATRTLASGTIETPRTNHIRNSSMQDAVAGSPGTMPTNWAKSLNGLVRQSVALGTENGVSYIDIRYSGTATGGSCAVLFETATQIVASTGQTWSNSVYLKIIAQPNPPVAYRLSMWEYNTNGTVFGLSFANVVVPTTTSLQRFTQTRALTGTTTDRVRPLFDVSMTSGQFYDFTIRIAAPQMELSSVATDWIRTTTSARTTFAGITQDGLSASNIPRLDYTYGSCPALLLEPQRTNSIRNSTMQGASTSPSTLPTNWGSVNNGITHTIVGVGTENGLPYVDVNFSGTATSTDTTLRFESVTQIVASSGQTWANTFYAKLISASSPPLSYNIALYQRTSTGTFVTITIIPFTPTSTLTRINNVVTITDATVARVQPTFLASVTNGASYDFTIRIAAPQIELGAYATTWINTTNAAATRLVDTFTRNNIYTNGLISASGGTWYMELRNNVAYTRDTFTVGLFISDTTNITGNNINIRNGGGGAVRLSINKVIAGVSTPLYMTTTNTVKLAIKWNGTSADIFENGVKVISATSFTPTIMENLGLNTGIVPYFIQAMALYPTPISDADCEVLTGTSYSSYSAMATALGYTIL